MGLERKTCVPCRGGIAPMEAAEAERMLRQTPGWELIEHATKIRRTFRFDTFAPAMAFALRVGEIAEQEGHHPDITFGWGYCTVQFHTHKIDGLHENDFVMAAKVNAIGR